MVAVPVYFCALFVLVGDFSTAAFLNLFPLVYFDVIVVYTFCMMWLIENELDMWLNKMQACSRSIVKLEFIENKKALRMFQTYRYILNAYDMFKKVCKVPIMFEILEIFTHVIIYLQVNIEIKIQRPEESLASDVQLRIVHLRFYANWSGCTAKSIARDARS
ncbi:hypothetical protein MSG28_013857 [Choristoneura fumiferana]|uniref:Uncharacterized protein n=1 Tax=Choristoneura fumiferana TaxID=7141 RepID=A0ACC0K9N5_CHOFU|nr:hypothetical protein MSG28_013857 [Choristoneura fumiferana]